MSVVPFEVVAGLLACPRCGSPLAAQPPYRCTRDDCPATSGFRLVSGRWPVLVDGDASIVQPAEVVAPVPAPSPASSRDSVRRLARAVLRRLVRPNNSVASAQIARLRSLLPADALILVVGGGSVGNGAEDLYRDPTARVLAFDIYASEHVQFVADAHAIPLREGSVDAVVIQAVLEHVLDPWQVVAEIHRVVKGDGLVYAETPFMQQVHAGAYDFTRFSDSGHRWLFRRFTQIDRGVVAGAGTALSWAIDHVVRAVTGSLTAGRVARLVFFWVRFADLIGDRSAARDSASAVFFLGRRAEHAITPAEAIAAYAGAQAEPTTLTGGATPSVV